MESKLQQQAPQKAPASTPNLTGIPTQMKLDFEQRSGLSFDDVRVHYNSDKPAQLQALAYTQGTQVYVGPGQERHLPHELGHVLQQKQGRVKATGKINNTLFNADSMLEHEADIMLHTSASHFGFTTQASGAPIQCRFKVDYDSKNKSSPWTAASESRPDFLPLTKRFFNQFETDDEKANRRKANLLSPSINHIISYYTISKLLQNIFEKDLNEQVLTLDGSKIHKQPKLLPSNPLKKRNMLAMLVRMLIPKKGDCIVRHNKNVIEQLRENRKFHYNILKTKKSPGEQAKLDKAIGKIEDEYTYLLSIYEETLISQRKDATSLIYCIEPFIQNPIIDIVPLRALINELETLLNSSIGNLRLGDANVNFSIGSHLDILNAGNYATPKLQSITDPPNSPKTLSDASYTLSLNDSFSDGKPKNPELSDMIKRLVKLCMLQYHLKTKDIPGFQVSFYHDKGRPTGTVHLLSSEMGKPDEKDGMLGRYIPGAFEVIHQKKTSMEQHKYNISVSLSGKLFIMEVTTVPHGYIDAMNDPLNSLSVTSPYPVSPLLTPISPTHAPWAIISSAHSSPPTRKPDPVTGPPSKRLVAL